MSSTPDSPVDKTDNFPPQSARLPRSSSIDFVGKAESSDEDASPPDISSRPEHPQRIGAYRIKKVLGQGGFGCVYLAHDEDAQRLVAIKVPLARRVSSPPDAEAYLEEARAVARLEHPAIVPLYHVGRDDQQSIFIVSKFVPGSDLAGRIANNRPSLAQSAQIIALVAEALHHAHKQGLVHRDIKPANILVDKDDKPYVADFGLALKEEAFGTGAARAGTPAYMSPEQARGEGHLVDGRSDLFSLGVVFYELLTGKRPFRGKTPGKILRQIQQIEVSPPRQLDNTIPEELERICLKALSKRLTDRYATGLDLAEDLRHFLSKRLPGKGAPETAHVSPHRESPPENQLAKIVPKGLRSFDENDADFFLELLPGPRGREGLPESLRFWKTCMEETDAEKTFRVGLVYGPSGCGKSSLIKAGLLPRLAEHVLSIYVESTGDDTETRLLNSLCKRFPSLATKSGLVESLSALRRGEPAGRGRKVLLVLDQFEQWLHAHREKKSSELTQALRHCDGVHVQCLVMVRDDFWMSAARFFRALEIRLVEGRNFAAVDLFEPLHARRVLSQFGQAYGRLPDNLGELDSAQNAFLDQAIGDLTQDGKIISVRLSLFAQMVQGKLWTPNTLHQMGGAARMGETFLEETFSATNAPPEHRLHQRAARRVLQRLLPEQGTNMKGHMRSQDELLKASGYAARPREFDDLLQILDQEVRLITPIDPEGVAAQDDDAEPVAAHVLGESYYQLTHDYLVPSIREWLTRKQKETRFGRAELRLAARLELWTAKPENRHLPSWWEYGNIRLFTRQKNWSQQQRQMMRKAGRVHGFRWGSAVLAALLIGVAIQQVVSSAREHNLLARTKSTVAAMSASRTVHVPRFIAELEQLPRQMVLVELRKQYAWDEERRKLTVAFALARFGEVEVHFLVSQTENASPDEVENLVVALGESKAESVRALKAFAERTHAARKWRLKARLAMLALHLKDSSLAEAMCQLRPDPIQRTLFIEECSTWHGDLTALSQRLADSKDGPLQSAIALAMGRVATGDVPVRLAQMFVNWYRSKPDGATHSGAGWALRRWNRELPKIPATKQPTPSRDWHVNSVGMTMLYIPAGRFAREVTATDPQDPKKQIRHKQKVAIGQPFFLSDREISWGQFLQFVNDHNYPPKERPQVWREANVDSLTAEYPAQMVNYYDAILFCNWLSRKEGLRPCYKRTGKKEKRTIFSLAVGHDAWRRIEDADGYRLPTEAEWEYACRAGTVTIFSHGSEESLLDRYAALRESRAEIRGSRLPNGWGLFNMHGNVSEWCHDWYGPFSPEPLVIDPTGPKEGKSRVLRGGSFSSDARSLRTTYRHSVRPPNRYRGVGFRPARTHD